jgi:putative membrane protein
MVLERAMRAFVEQGVTETRDRSGVLIFLSEAEHQVVILADKGINDRVEPSRWQTDVDGIVLAIKEGRAGAGVIAAVDRIGGLLAEAFPPRADDTNELSDAVRVVD